MLRYLLLFTLLVSSSYGECSDPNKSLKVRVEIAGYRVCVRNFEGFRVGHEWSVDPFTDIRVRYRASIENPTEDSVELEGWESSPDFSLANTEADARAGHYITETVTDSFGPWPTEAANRFKPRLRIAPKKSVAIGKDLLATIRLEKPLWLHPGQEIYLQFWFKLEPSRDTAPDFKWESTSGFPTEPVRFLVPNSLNDASAKLTEELNRNGVIANKELCTAETK